MKSRRSDVRCKAHAIPELNFENQSLTSFAGLVLLQQFFTSIDLKARLRRCFRHLSGTVFGRATIFHQLIVHLLLGYRELRDSQYYRDDPLVQRVLGLKRLHQRIWRVCLVDKDRSERTVVTKNEADILLRGWLSPLGPPPIERLTDLA